jgi:HK97 family phage major capsid protein
MDTKILNARKMEILDAQEKMLKSATENKVAMSVADEASFTNMTSELDTINITLSRYAAIEKGKVEVATPREQAIITNTTSSSKKTFSNCTADYATAFWNALSTRNFSNAALGEGGTAANGSYLVPAQTNPNIAALANIEAAARRLSKVIPTSMDIKLPYQASKAVAAGKAESTNSGTNAFGTSVPTFATTTLSAFMAGDSVAVSWELMQDVGALESFLTAELNRAVFNYEEGKFINGSGASEPLGYLTGATESATASLTADSTLDLTGALKSAYYNNASFLLNRQEFIRLYKQQIAASQFQNYITYDGNGAARLHGFPVVFSSQMPVYEASPAVTGAVLFGDFASGFVIGDRGNSNIQVKVLDQVAALNGQTIVLGFRRTDQRCVLQEAVQLLTTNG